MGVSAESPVRGSVAPLGLTAESLESAYPLPPGVELVPAELLTDPLPLGSVPFDAWEGICLAKRRLATLGPLEAGQEAARMAAIILAAELALRDVPQKDAEEACRLIPFTTSTTPRRGVLRQIPRAVRFAYNPPHGGRVLTGCPRDPKHTEGATTTARLRSYFAPYCDGNCARTCKMLRDSLNPAGLVYTGPYRNVLQAEWLWTQGAGLGPIGRDLYERMAAITLGEPNATIWASGRFLAAKLGHRVNSRHVARILARMHELGLATLEDKKQGWRKLHVHDGGWLADLAAGELREQWQQVARNERQARQESDDYLRFRILSEQGSSPGGSQHRGKNRR